MTTDPHSHADLASAPNGLKRRTFMRYMAASALLAGVGLPACRRVERYLVPYNRSPEWTIPGVSTSYATCYPHAQGGIPVLATCYEGRPVHIAPNRGHGEGGGVPAQVGASVLNLYDPYRSKRRVYHQESAKDDEFLGAFSAWSKKVNNNGKVAFLFSETPSPVRATLIQDIARRNKNAQFFSWEPISQRNQLDALSGALRENTRQHIRFQRAKRILSLDCDFLGLDRQGSIEDFTANRHPEGKNYREAPDYERMSRLYSVESQTTLTGVMADNRLPMPAHLMYAAILSFAHQIAVLTQHVDMEWARTPHDCDKWLTKQMKDWVKMCAHDMVAHKNAAVVVLGLQYPPAWHSLVLTLNSALGAFNNTVQLLQGDVCTVSLCQPLGNLPQALKNGSIETLFILCDANPVFDAPREFELGKLLRDSNVESVQLSLYYNSTAAACQWHIPAAHYLERWGVERDVIGRLSFMQPTILPLYGGVSELELLIGLLHSKGVLITAETESDNLSPAYMRIKKWFTQTVPQLGKEEAWLNALKRGFAPGTEFPHIQAAPTPLPIEQVTAMCSHAEQFAMQGAGQVGVVFAPDYSVYDGRYIDNAWLRECPDPITGVCWDGAAQVNPHTLAEWAGIDSPPSPSDLYLISLSPHNLKFYACAVPTCPPDTLVLPLGYTEPNYLDYGQVIASDAYALRMANNPLFRQIPRADIICTPCPARTVAQLPPAVVPRPPISCYDVANAPRADAKEEAVSDVKLAELNLPADSDPYHQWGMCIDLSLCTGCNACVIACQSENNIPVVGKAEVIKGRVMHWMRIDRYFVQSELAGQYTVSPQPMACQQCGNAPCESVCPLNATVHTAEGLNAMAYPRCWGTRYCASNCPYKVRRFNFFDYSKGLDPSTQLLRNPNVSVRSRGVMEKCSYCVQRIEQAKIKHKARVTTQLAGNNSAMATLPADQMRLPSDAVQTACQLACPMGAIKFGNLLEQGDVYMAKLTPRNSVALGELNTAPRTSFMACVKNPNPILEKQNSCH